MKAFQFLPDGYKEIFSIHIQRDKKIALVVNLLGVLIMLAFAIPMHFLVPITSVFSMEKGMGEYIFRFCCALIFLVVYMVLHELIHGITMKMCGTKKVKYGFTGMYAYAGSEDYYDKKSYIVIALAPIVVLGAIIAIINAFVPLEWFWIVYYVQLANLSGAAGDIYVSARFSRLPKDILVQDSGLGMTVYSKQ